MAICATVWDRQSSRRMWASSCCTTTRRRSSLQRTTSRGSRMAGRSVPNVMGTLTSSLKKECRVHYFERTGADVVIKDISSLDPGSDDQAVAGWGGLSGFSGDVADWVGEALTSGGVA